MRILNHLLSYVHAQPSLGSPELITEQELGQTDISVLRKAELKDRLTSIRKAFDKQMKEKEAAAHKQVSHF